MENEFVKGNILLIVGSAVVSTIGYLGFGTIGAALAPITLVGALAITLAIATA